MAVHIATPEEIDGAHDESETKVLHITGPFAGMLLVNKLTEPSLPLGLTNQQIILPQGSVVVPAKSTADIAEVGAGPLNTSPAAYPHDTWITLRYIGNDRLAPGASVGFVTVLGGVPAPSVEIAPVDVMGDGNGPWFWTHPIPSAGVWSFQITNPNGSMITIGPITMNAVPPPAPPPEEEGA